MGLGGPGHRSGERAAAAATVGAPRLENNKKLPGSGSTVRRYSNSRQFRTYFPRLFSRHVGLEAAHRVN
ncbi:hypothetical protein PBY51_018249 [Eleginops maclovinus]|uniref:Uncharacterized protein n=1 Tax=Eleginops maclovinus TaxID=56733 RepID=A0AAN7XLC1_ELEMC|nr:hypothetical protein PBY51_018249 [Eleginops maclovinus]